MILTPAQAIALGDLEEQIVTEGLRDLADGADPKHVADWLARQVRRYPILDLAPALQECPSCRAVHAVKAYPREGMDDGWCSEACRDDTAEQMYAQRYQTRDAA